MDNIEILKSKIKNLEEENKYLKELLENAGISYSYAQKQIDNKIIPFDVTPEIANKFFSMFWGRTDVYAKRTIQKSTGKVNYYPQCNNFWKDYCPRKHGAKIKCADCDKQSYKKLEKEQVIAHLKGEKADGSDVIGIYPLLPDDTCRFIVFDFDNHSNDDVSNLWQQEVSAMRQICEINGIDALVERSRSGNGAHLWIFFDEKIVATLARKFGNLLIKKGSEFVNLKSFDYYDRMLPMHDYLKSGGLGSLIALPLQGQALKNGNSAFVDENFNAYSEQLEILFSKQKLSQAFLEEKIALWNKSDVIADVDVFDEQPLDKTVMLHASDVAGKVQIVLADGIYINTNNLQPRIQNRIREMAAFHNPVFYKNQIMGLSNFQNARYIYLGKDGDGYINYLKLRIKELQEMPLM